MTIGNTQTSLATLVLLAGFYTPAATAIDDGPLSMKLSTGVEYDSNLTVSDVDISSNLSDFAAALDFALLYKSKVGDGVSLELGYDFSQSLHFDVTSFDMQMHTASAGLETEVSGMDLGLSFSYINSRLGGEAFMDMKIINPSIAKMIGNTYLRGSYSYVDKSFDVATTRDAKTHSFGVDMFQFMDNGNFFNAGVHFESENAVADTLDYDAFVINGGFQSKFDLYGKTTQLNVGLEHWKRSYDTLTPSIAALREDKRTSFKTSLEAPVFDSISAKASYRFINATSNLDTADYNEHIVGFTLGYSF